MRSNVWTYAFTITFMFMLFVGNVRAEDVPDYLHEAQTCSRVDLRPALEKAGFDLVRNRGGREDNLSFALSEMLGLAIEQPISARWLEHWLEDHDAQSFLKTQTMARAVLAARLRPCLEDAVKSEDVESTRLARLRMLSNSRADLNPSVLQLLEFFGTPDFKRVSITPYTCQESERTRDKSHAALTLTQSRDAQMIDRSLRAGRLPLVVTDSTAPRPKTFTVAGRRLSASSSRCEYLVRNYEGPTCAGSSCEDGSQWIERERFAKSLKSVWSLEP